MTPHHLRRGTAKSQEHFSLVNRNADNADQNHTFLEEELMAAPLFSLSVCESLNSQRQGQEGNGIYPQYGLLGLRTDSPEATEEEGNMVYTNTSAPWSTFICGSQGSGKSHTLSCLLENALIASSPAGSLSSPLAGLVMHYDKFTAFSSTQLCEAVYLSSSRIPVRILVSPTNFAAMKAAYLSLPGLKDSANLITVEPLYLPQRDLTISMMKTLMGIDNKPEQPLYLEVVMKILRDLAIASQGQAGFNYEAFKLILENEHFLKGQLIPLKMRLSVLESFFEPGSVVGGKEKVNKSATSPSTFSPGTLTIIDLSCPFVGPDDACVLFNICVSLFLKGRRDAGRILALDEAHKFMGSTSPEAVDMTETLLSVVRQQRHLGARVLIATQEPTLSPDLLALCNLTIIHRFSSPAWFKAIRTHIAGAGMERYDPKNGALPEIFQKIVRLATGEALVFCPTALLDVEKATHQDESSSSSALCSEQNFEGNVSTSSIESHSEDAGSSNAAKSAAPRLASLGSRNGVTEDRVVQLGTAYAHIRMRKRVTMDGGRSILEK